jgi:hypothetical protein
MCLTLNSADEWAGSSFQVVMEVAVVVVAMDWLLSPSWMRSEDIRCNKYFGGKRIRRA